MNTEKEPNPLYINNPSSKILDRIKLFSGKTEVCVKHTNKEIILFEQVPEEKINIWEISRRVYVIGEMWDKDTNFENNMNNIRKTIRYLNNKFTDGFCLFSKQQKLKVKYLLNLSSINYSLEGIFSYSLGIRTWLDLNSKHVVVIELDYMKLNQIGILIEYIRIYTGSQSASSIFLLNDKILKAKNFEENIIKRYKECFQNIHKKKIHEYQNRLNLHQLIISNYPHIGDSSTFKIHLNIYNNNILMRSIKDILDNGKFFRDEYYIVFTNLDFEFIGDMLIELCFVTENESVTMLQFPFHRIFFNQGLYRFTNTDILSDHKQIFTNEFMIDLVFLETNNQSKILDVKYDIMKGIKFLTDVLINENCTEKRPLKYNKILTDFIFIMGYSDTEIENLEGILKSNNCSNIYKTNETSPIINTEPIKEDNTIEITPVPTKVSINREESYKKVSSSEIKVVYPIEDIVEPEIKQIKKSKKIRFIKKEIEISNTKSLLYESIRPLHLTPTGTETNTIFQNTEHIEINLDKEEFIKKFCIKKNERNEKKIDIRQNNMLIDSKRLFLISLALKHLSKKNITPENVYHILKTKPKDVYIQDLLNISYLFPTYEEAYILASSNVSNLNIEEINMLKYSKLIEVQKMVQILIFEKTFFEEIFLLEELLEKITFTFRKIIESKELKIIFLTLLEIGNLINYEFSSKPKKVNGFKLASVYLFFDYKGNDDYLLQKYFLSSINHTEIIPKLSIDFKYLNIIRKEQFSKLKDKINYFIDKFMEIRDVYDTLESDKNQFKKFLIFVSEKLIDLKAKYAQCLLIEKEVKKMFDENEKKQISDLLDCIAFVIDNIINHKEDIKVKS